MSVYVFRDTVTSQQEETIRKVLSFTPHIPEHMRKNITMDMQKTIQAWIVEDYEYGGTILRLPFQVGRALLKTDNNGCDFDVINHTMKITLREKQFEPIRQAIDYLNKYNTVLLQMRMGLGKTVMSCFLAIKIGFKTVVLTADVDLSKQWATEIRTKGGKAWVVGEEPEPAEWHFATCYYSENRWKQIQTRDKIGTLIIDECHEFNNTTGVKAMLHFSPKFIIACSATPQGSENGMDRIMRSVVGDYKVDIIDPVELDIVRLNTGIAGVREKGRMGVDATKLRQSFLYNDARNAQILYCAQALLYYGIKTLIVTREVAHVKLLHSEIVKFYQWSDYLCGDKKTYNDSMITVGILDKTGTGFDEANYCANWQGMRIRCVLLASSIAKLGLTKQCVGRAFRHDNPILLYPVDKDSNSRKHYNILHEWEKLGEIIPTYHITDQNNVSLILQKIAKSS